MATLSGRLTARSRITMSSPGPLGRADPSQHRPDGPTAPDRAQGVPGLPPPAAMTGPLSAPSDSGPGFRPDHTAGPSHRGPGGNAPAHPALASTDRRTGGDHTPQQMYGAGGAAHGGIRPSGSSQAWANPGGIRMGMLYHPASVARPQSAALHLNTPRMRAIRYSGPVPGNLSSPYPGGQSGTSTPITSPFNPAAIARGSGTYLPRTLPVQRTGSALTADQVPGDYADPGPIGGGWAL
jgi:hypothetical protein